MQNGSTEAGIGICTKINKVTPQHCRVSDVALLDCKVAKYKDTAMLRS